LVIDDRGHPIIRADFEKSRLELFAGANIDRHDLVFEAGFSRKIVILCPLA